MQEVLGDTQPAHRIRSMNTLIYRHNLSNDVPITHRFNRFKRHLNPDERCKRRELYAIAYLFICQRGFSLNIQDNITPELQGDH